MFLLASALIGWIMDRMEMWSVYGKLAANTIMFVFDYKKLR